MILKKFTLEGFFFYFLHPDPQLDDNLKPTRKFDRVFFYIPNQVYMRIVFNTSSNQKTLTDPFDGVSNPCLHKSGCALAERLALESEGKL